MIPSADLAIEHRPYRPYGAAEKVLYGKEPEILLSGPAGTGKSRACLEKLHLVATKYAGTRGLIIRKTRESLTESALVTWEEKVVESGHVILEGPRRNYRQSYHYANGSEIVVGGMDKPGKVMSTEYDLVYVQEAIELTEQDWENLTTRLRNAVVPYNQIIADTNPDGPQHWLKLRCNTGKTVLLDSRHEDNPTLWDHGKNDWTPNGRTYIAKLDSLTGARLARLRHGQWVQAEGVVYEDWDRAKHIVDAVDLSRGKQFVAGVDWGFTHAGAIEVGMADGDGRLTIVAEVYRSKQTIDWWIAEAKALRDRYHIERFVCDPSEPAYIEQFNRAGLRASEAINDVMPGIGAVQARLRIAGDGRPRLQYLRSALQGRDPVLEEAKKPCSVVEEMDCYIWNTTSGRRKGEEPVKENDHGQDALRYLVAHFDVRPQRRLAVWA